jgi:hypothetical protein
MTDMEEEGWSGLAMTMKNINAPPFLLIFDVTVSDKNYFLIHITHESELKNY